MNKLRRPSAQEYIDADIIMSAYGGRMPTQDEFILTMREQWEESFTDAERLGIGSGLPGPITFSYYLQLSRVALIGQMKAVIPMKVKEGLLTKEAAGRNIDLIKQLIEYENKTITQIT